MSELQETKAAEEQAQDYVHFTEKSGGMFLVKGPATLSSKQTFTKVPATEDNASLDIAMWGTNNMLPQEMMADIEKTGVLIAGLEAKARIAVGKGPIPMKVVSVDKDGNEVLEYVNSSEILDWLEMNNAFDNSYSHIKDLYSVGNCWSQLLTRPDRSYIHGYKRMDPLECRLEKWSKATGRINNVVISSDWTKYNTANDSDGFVKSIPMLDRDFPLMDLQSRSKGSNFAVCLQYPLSGRKYYAPAPWYSALNWVRIAQGVPEMKAAMFNNQMNLKYVVEIAPDFWEHYDAKYKASTPKDQQEIRTRFMQDVDKYLVGGQNSFKSFFAPMKVLPATNQLESLIKFTALDDKIKDGKLLPDSAAANIEILLPLMIQSCLLGVDMPGGDAYSGGAGSGSNIREAYLVQVMLLELERRMNNKVFDVVKHVNGWAKKFPGLTFRYPNQILTTLNTGANTKGTA